MPMKIQSYYAALTIIFSFFFLHAVFLFNDDVGLIVAVEVDPGSITGSIMQLFNYPIYNQHNGYHTQYYGWVFNDINFIVILLLKILGQSLGFYDKPIFNSDFIPAFAGVIRTTTFSMGLISNLIFFNIANHLFKNEKLSFFATLFFMFVPLGSYFSYFIHPETTGMVFTLTAILYLVKFTNVPKLRYFYISYISVILAALSKQPFTFVAVPILLVFFISYYYEKNLTCKQFLKILLSMAVIGVFIILLVHPYALIEFSRFYESQRATLVGHQSTISLSQNFYNWANIYSGEILVSMNIILLIIAIMLLAVNMFFRKIVAIHFLFIVSLSFCNVFLLIVIYGARLLVAPTYLYPILPLLILNIMAVLVFIWGKLTQLHSGKYWRFVFAITVTIYLLPIFSANWLVTTNNLLNRASYKNTTNYQARQFILENVARNNVIIHDVTIPVPSNYTNSCISWNCSVTENTNFVILQEGYPYPDHKPIYSHITDHSFVLISTIQANTTIEFSSNSFEKTKKLLQILRTSGPHALRVGPNILIYQKVSARDIQEKAKLHYQSGKFEDAIELYSKHLKLSEVVNDQRTIVVDKIILIRMYEQQKRFVEALTLAEQLSQMLKISDDSFMNQQGEEKISQIKLTNFYLSCYLDSEVCRTVLDGEKISLAERVEQTYSKLESVDSSDSNTKYSIANVNFQLGRFYVRVGNFAKAQESYQKAIDLYTLLDDKLRLIETYSALAAGYSLFSDPQNDLEKNIRSEINLRLKIIDLCSSSKGSCPLEQIKSESENLTTLYEMLGDSAHADDYFQLGFSYAHLDNFIKAIENYQKAIGLYTQLDDKLKLIETYSALAVAYAMSSSQDNLEANMHHEIDTRLKIVQLYQSTGNLERLKDEYQNLVILYQSLGEDAQAQNIMGELDRVNTK